MSDTKILQSKIRDVKDFPKKGIIFKDITPLLQDGSSFQRVISQMVGLLRGQPIDVVVGIESRGFIFASALAHQLGVGFVPIRKKGKLPWKTERMACTLEYGEEILEIHQDGIRQGQKVAIVDDLLATGGTTQAAVKLIEKLGGKIEAILFMIELTFLKGREKLSKYPVQSLMEY